MHDALFQPLRLGAIEAPNRILMAPLTRGRSRESDLPPLLCSSPLPLFTPLTIGIRCRPLPPLSAVSRVGRARDPR